MYYQSEILLKYFKEFRIFLWTLGKRFGSFRFFKKGVYWEDDEIGRESNLVTRQAFTVEYFQYEKEVYSPEMLDAFPGILKPL